MPFKEFAIYFFYAGVKKKKQKTKDLGKTREKKSKRISSFVSAGHASYVKEKDIYGGIMIE